MTLVNRTRKVYDVINKLKANVWDRTKTNYPINQLSQLVTYFREPFPVDPEHHFFLNHVLSRMSQREKEQWKNIFASFNDAEIALMKNVLESLGGGINERAYVRYRGFNTDGVEASLLRCALTSNDPSPILQLMHDTP